MEDVDHLCRERLSVSALFRCTVCSDWLLQQAIQQTLETQKKFNEQADFFYWQTYGILSDDYLQRVDKWKNVSQQDGGIQRSIDISVIQKWVVEHPKFMPLKTVALPNGEFKQIVDMKYAMNYPVPIAPEVLYPLRSHT